MDFINSRKFRVGLLIVALMAFSFNVYWFRVVPVREARGAMPKAKPKGKSHIPPEGVAENDTHGKVPGNPDKTIADMHTLYEKISLYRQLHGGNYFINSQKFRMEMAHDKAYGFGSLRNMVEAFRNPDVKYADMAQGMPHSESLLPYVLQTARPDGSPIGSPKPAGTRDVLAHTDIYFHSNFRTFTGDKTTSEPVGFYLVLWDDGEIQKISHKEVTLLKQQGNAPTPETFPGQAGVADGAALPYAECRIP